MRLLRNTQRGWALLLNAKVLPVFGVVALAVLVPVAAKLCSRPGAFYSAVAPPSMTNSLPVTKDDSSDARYKAA